jgi:hypothetical protein
LVPERLLHRAAELLRIRQHGIGVISLTCAGELAAGSRLARAVSAYGAVFWGIRLCLQAVFDVKPHLSAWWLTAGYHLLTVLFLCFTLVYGYAAAH